MPRYTREKPTQMGMITPIATNATLTQWRRVCQSMTTMIAEYATAAPTWPEGKLDPTGDVSSLGTFGRGRPTSVVTVMNVRASRIRETTTTSGSSQRFQTINISVATIAVMAIFTTVSDIIDPMYVSEFRVGVRRPTNHLEIDPSVWTIHEFERG